MSLDVQWLTSATDIRRRQNITAPNRLFSSSAVNLPSVSGIMTSFTPSVTSKRMSAVVVRRYDG